MSASAESHPASPWWWKHCSIEEAAEPLDPTADDAAAACLDAIVTQTAQNIVSQQALLSPHLDSSLAEDAAAAAALDVYAQLRWDAVLPPLLGQLRKAMTRAWEERAAEQAEAAATEGVGFNQETNTHSANSNMKSVSVSSSPTQESVTAAACADPVLLRRLRVLQQQIYFAFLKAVLQGLTNGVRCVAALDKKGDATDTAAQPVASHTGIEEITEGERTSQKNCADNVARCVALLLDGLLARLIEAAAATPSSPSSSTTAPASSFAEEAHKARRGHHLSAPAAAAPVQEWLAGMIPLYVRAAQRSAQLARSGTNNEAAPVLPSHVVISSPALCLLSYVGVFVQDAGLQLLPSEQAAQLPFFTAVVHRVFLTDLRQRCETAVSHARTACCSSSDVSQLCEAATESAATAAVALIRSASNFFQHLTVVQLYSEGRGAEVDDDDCTALYRAPPRQVPSTYAYSKKQGTPANSGDAFAAADYSVASLLSLSTYQACSPILSELEKWWMACRSALIRARAAVKMQAKGVSDSPEEEGKETEEGQQAKAAKRAALLKEAEDAWLALRRHTMTASLVFSNYAETTLLLVPYTALLTSLFYTTAAEHNGEQDKKADEEEDKNVDLSPDAWKACIRELHHVTRATYGDAPRTSSSSTNSSSSGSNNANDKAGTAASTRRLRQHYRNVGSLTFPAASYLRVPTALSDATGHALTPTSAEEDETVASASNDAFARHVLPLVFSLLHQPLTVLQERVLHMLIAPGAVNTQLKVDTVVGEKGSVADKSASAPGMEPKEADGSLSSSLVTAAAASARAKASRDVSMTADQIVDLSFPRHYRVLRAIDLAMQYIVIRSQELIETTLRTSSSSSSLNVDSLVLSPGSIPALVAQFFGAALDEAFIMRMRTGSEEVCGSELLMFYATVFRTLPRGALPYLRAALATFLGPDGSQLLTYIRHHIVDQQRHGLAAFFLPPLRALGLDYSTVEETDISLALSAKASYAAAMAYAWELPRLFFWRCSNTPVAEVAWHAHAEAQQYVRELMTHNTPPDSAFMDILMEASDIAHRRSRKAVGSSTSTTSVKVFVPPSAEAAGTDAMMSLFLGVYRWCSVQLSVQAPTTLLTSSFSSSSPLVDAIRAALTAMCAPIAEKGNEGTGATTAALHPFLQLLRLQIAKTDATAEEIKVENGAAAEVVASPSAFPYRVVKWIWACTYDAVAPEHLQACAKRLLRDFSVQFGQYAPIKTVLGIRAMVEQKMKTEEAADAAAALRTLVDAMRADVQELLAHQQERERQKALAKTEPQPEKAAVAAEVGTAEVEKTGEKATESETPVSLPPHASAESTTSPEDEAVEACPSVASSPTTGVAIRSAVTAAAAATTVLAGAAMRSYVDQIFQALVARARLSPVDGAVSAAALAHLIRAFSDPHLPLQMTPQDRQRLCERFVFTLTSSVPDQTRMEASSCACSLRLVLENIVLPFKKSFLEKTPSLRVFHGCLSDNEADAFKMVQHTLGDVMTAFQKCQAEGGPVSMLDDWKAVLLLEHTGSVLSLVRSLLEKTRVTVRKAVLKRKTCGVEALHRQLLRMEKEAARCDRGVADDVFHLFTHHPLPPPTPVPPATAAAVVAALMSDKRLSGAPTSTTLSSTSSGKRPRSGRRLRLKELNREAQAVQNSNERMKEGDNSGDGGRGGDGDGEGRVRNVRKRDREDDRDDRDDRRRNRRSSSDQAKYGWSGRSKRGSRRRH